MPIRKTFLDDKSFKNIELGAGCGNFGEKYYSKCLITDSDEEIHSRCRNNHIHFVCPAYKIPVPSDRFKNVIMCNPWGYGFKETEDAEALMNEIVRILSSEGKVVIICNTTNKFCTPHKVRKKLAEMALIKGKYQLTEEDIDCKKEYAGYQFQQTNGFPASPNKKITINVKK